jgi:hypothetical protein
MPWGAAARDDAGDAGAVGHSAGDATDATTAVGRGHYPLGTSCGVQMLGCRGRPVNAGETEKCVGRGEGKVRDAWER